MNRRKERRFRPLRWSALVHTDSAAVPWQPQKGHRSGRSRLETAPGSYSMALVEPQSFRMGPPGQGGLRHCSVRSVVRFC